MGVNGANNTLGKGGIDFYQKQDAGSGAKDFTTKMTKDLLQKNAEARTKSSGFAASAKSNYETYFKA